MPIVIDKDIPAFKILTGERIFVIDTDRAFSQEIRPIEIAILNLMPTKETTETQFMRLLSNSPLQVNITLVRTATYNPTHTEQEHLKRFYKSFDEMAMKTLIRQLIGKWGIMSIDMQTAMESDVDAETEYLKGAANFNMAMPVEIVQDEEPTPEELAEAAADIHADEDGVVLEGVPDEDKPKRGRPVREEAPQEA